MRLTAYSISAGTPKAIPTILSASSTARRFSLIFVTAGVIDLAESTMGQHAISSANPHGVPIPVITAGRRTPTVCSLNCRRMSPPTPASACPIYLCTAHYYLDDLTLDLAPTWVIPGSHKSGHALSLGQRVRTGVQWTQIRACPVQRRAMSFSSAAKSGTPAAKTHPTKRATCCKSTTPTAGSLPNSRPL